MATFHSPDLSIPVVDISRFVKQVHAHQHASGKMQHPPTHAIREIGVDKGDDLDTEKQLIASQWDKAFREHGFAVIIGHGIPSEVVVALETAMDAFFAGLSHDEKMRYNRGCYGTPLGGYNPLFTEAVGQSSSVSIDGTGGSGGVRSGIDAVESFAFTTHPLLFKAKLELSSAPTSASSSSLIAAASRLMDCAAAYYSAVEQLLYLLHRISAYALGLPYRDFINDHYQFHHQRPLSIPFCCKRRGREKQQWKCTEAVPLPLRGPVVAGIRIVAV